MSFALFNQGKAFLQTMKNGFKALLNVHGTNWSFDGVEFRAIAQSGAYAAYNFVDGNTAIKILRFFSDDLPVLPSKGQVIESNGKKAIVQRSRQIDNLFSEIEIDEI